MSIGIKVTLQPDGSLLMQANNETRSGLAYARDDNYDRAMGDFIEMVTGEFIAKRSPLKGTCYTLASIDPAAIYAMTDMPLLGDACTDDDDATRVYGPVWGFIGYEVADPIEELIRRGRTVFQLVADFGPDGITFPCRYHRSKESEYLARRVYENCLDGHFVTEQVPDLHNEGETIARVVDYAPNPPAPVIASLL